jgi:hypothetical protein
MADEDYTPEEIARRRDDAIRRALNTPPKPNSAYVGEGKGDKVAKRSRVRKGKSPA